MRKIYVASSWRNSYQPSVVNELRALGHQVYDFRGLGDGMGGEDTCVNCQEAQSLLKYPNTGSAGGYFKHCPAHRTGGFSWLECDSKWETWTPNEYLIGLHQAAAERGFKRDMEALIWADTCIMVMPCGPSASMEMGFAVGAGKRVAVYLPEIREPDLMVKMAECLSTGWDAIKCWLHDLEEVR